MTKTITPKTITRRTRQSVFTATSIRSTSVIEYLEGRQLLAVTWSTYAKLIGQDTAASTYSSLTGSGETIAMIDTGIDYNNSSLGGGIGKGKKVIGGYDFLDNDSDPMDTDGHGTETAGMVAANRFTYNGTTYQGIAPDAKLVALRVGTGDNITDNNIEKALQWVIKNYKTYGISVVNISLGSGAYDTATTAGSQLTDEFAQLAKLNIVVVAASGNDGDTHAGADTVAYPAADPNVFAAGSIDSADQISSFTQRGVKLGILAPGEQVVSTKKGGGYDTIDGTSFSSPLMAGVFALLKQAAGSLSAKDLESVVRSSSVTQYDGDGDAGYTTQTTYARLELPDAIKLAQTRATNSKLTSIASSRSATVDSAYDQSGVLHLAYYDAKTHKLMYTTQQGNGDWATPTVVDTSSHDTGRYLSLAIDPTGKAAIAYYDTTAQDLKYATFATDKWSTIAVDSKNSVGQYASLAFDNTGEPMIAYYKRSGGDLKLATLDRTTSTWSKKVIDSTGDVGEYASLAFSSSGGPTVAIAYEDATNGNLKYWRQILGSVAGNGTVMEVVDDLSGVANIDLQLVDTATIQGARIAYQDTKNADVKVAYKATNWYTAKVATSGTVGQSVSSYVDSNGDYHVVYYNKTKGATYSSKISAPTVSQSGTLVAAATIATTTRVGTSGQIGDVAVDADGNVSLVGLNKAGKSIAASVLESA